MTAQTKDRPLLELARQAMPALIATHTALARVKAARTAAHGQLKPDSDVHDQVLADVLAGKPVPDDLGTQLLRRRQHNEALRLHLGALDVVEGGVHEDRRSSAERQVDMGLNVLAEHLADLLVQARPVVGALARVESAEAAITAGHPEQWATLRRLAARHTELRSAQAALVSEALYPPTDARQQTGVVKREARGLVDSYGTVRNFDAMFPDGLPDEAMTARGGGVRIVNGRVVSTTVNEAAVDAPPWLTSDPVDALRYLAGPDAEPWVPTLAELIDARDMAASRRAGAKPEPQSLMVSEARGRQLSAKLPAMQPAWPTPVGGLGNPEL